ncbi:MAG: WYL domain-containing protein [Candidatus Symbiothrix sp.]|nr:WYL domain-containing protein [Candidatus Symbiothrix sp.]
MAKDLFNKYIWLVDTIYRAEKITFEEINQKWMRNEEMSGGEALPARTFHNQRTAIEELFDINIDCDRRNGYVYFIANKDDMEKGGVRSWLLNTFAVNNLINESHKLKQRILFEEIPSGQRFLTPIIEAMRDGLKIKITYQSFWSGEPHTFEIEPYCVKVFKQRWYLLAYSPDKDALRTYALDRIQDLCMTDKPFKICKSFNAEIYFDNAFGITVDENISPCVVKIKVFGNKRKYFNALPLHHSQEEIIKEEDYSVFRYFISPTYEFRQELLSHGAEIEVVSPLEFRAEMAEMAKAMTKLYD